jgi:hypothetical protein
MRLEGWTQHVNSRPSFETAASRAAIRENQEWVEIPPHSPAGEQGRDYEGWL